MTIMPSSLHRWRGRFLCSFISWEIGRNIRNIFPEFPIFPFDVMDNFRKFANESRLSGIARLFCKLQFVQRMVVFIFFLLLILLIALMAYGVWYSSPKQKGKRGEACVYECLQFLSDEYTIFNDVILSNGRGTTQIDHVFVSPYAIFVIETKNYRGEIYGNDEREEWTQMIVTDVTYRRKWYKTYTYVTKNHFYNPVKQCLGHARGIKDIIADYPCLPIVPIVVFVGQAYLKVESKYHVVYIEDLLDVINQYKAIYLSSEETVKVVALLNSKNKRNDIDDSTHILNIRFKQQLMVEQIDNGICPRCGGRLVERKGRYGYFIGCSNYPKCRFTM